MLRACITLDGARTGFRLPEHHVPVGDTDDCRSSGVLRNGELDDRRGLSIQGGTQATAADEARRYALYPAFGDAAPISAYRSAASNDVRAVAHHRRRRSNRSIPPISVHICTNPGSPASARRRTNSPPRAMDMSKD